MPAATGGWHQLLNGHGSWAANLTAGASAFIMRSGSRQWQTAAYPLPFTPTAPEPMTRSFRGIIWIIWWRNPFCAGKPDGTCFRNHTPLPCQMCRLRRKPENREGLLLKNIVRMRFAKTGRARYISHLDLIRCFQRAVCRAKLPAAYSEGFHPHMRDFLCHHAAAGVFSTAEQNGLGTDRGAAL